MDNMESMRKFSGEMEQRGGHINVTISHDGQTCEHDLESMIIVGIDYGSHSVIENKSTCRLKGEATGKLSGEHGRHLASGLKDMLAADKLRTVRREMITRESVLARFIRKLIKGVRLCHRDL